MSVYFEEVDRRPTPIGTLSLRRRRELSLGVDVHEIKLGVAWVSDAPEDRLTDGLMTCFQTDDERFAEWHCRKDPTHVVFYREATMHMIAGMRGWTCEIAAKDVALMHKT